MEDRGFRRADAADGELISADVELALSHPEGDRAPTSRGDHPQLLPGIEPERQLTDWGRSERVEALLDRTLYDFLYHYWFRVEVEGIENVPGDGGALLVANHAGALPPDGIMIAKALREQHPRHRRLHLAVESHWKGIPGAGMIITKGGGVTGHPANLHRLLLDERSLVLVFPEGSMGPRKPLADRYRLRDFGRGGFVQTAIRAGAPIVPVAVVGSEEAQPVLARLRVLPPVRALARLPQIPLTTALPLPAKLKVRFLEPVATDALAERDCADERLVRTLSDDLRALIQENLLEMVAARRSVWLG